MPLIIQAFSSGAIAALTAAICSAVRGRTGRRHSPTLRPERLAAALATGLNGSVQRSRFRGCMRRHRASASACLARLVQLVELHGLLRHRVRPAPEAADGTGHQAIEIEVIAAVEDAGAGCRQLLDAQHVRRAVLDVPDGIDLGKTRKHFRRDVEARELRDVVDHDRNPDRPADLLEVPAHAGLARPLEVRRQDQQRRGPDRLRVLRVLDRVLRADGRGLHDELATPVDVLRRDLRDPALLRLGKKRKLAGAAAHGDDVDLRLEHRVDVRAQRPLVDPGAVGGERGADRDANALELFHAASMVDAAITCRPAPVVSAGRSRPARAIRARR